MPDTFTNFIASPTSVPPLTRAICTAMPTTMMGNTVGPALTDKSFRALLDALAGLETRLTTAGF
jgi:hypothetical protein